MIGADCVNCREALSARMDGEAEPGPAARTDSHLLTCAACRDWQADAEELARATRAWEEPPMPERGW